VACKRSGHEPGTNIWSCRPLWEPFFPMPWEFDDAGRSRFSPRVSCIVRVGTRACKTGRFHPVASFEVSPGNREGNDLDFLTVPLLWTWHLFKKYNWICSDVPVLTRQKWCTPTPIWRIHFVACTGITLLDILDTILLLLQKL
jgi:hypothetical protein